MSINIPKVVHDDIGDIILQKQKHKMMWENTTIQK
jgi:hypothetical protein